MQNNCLDQVSVVVIMAYLCLAILLFVSLNLNFVSESIFLTWCFQ